MKLLTYNVLSGGVKPDSSRLGKVLRIITEQNADILGLQETLLLRGKENQLITALHKTGVYKHDVVFDSIRDRAQMTGVALFSKDYSVPMSARLVGERVKAVEMTFETGYGELSLCNVYLHHLSEARRQPQIREVLQELGSRKNSILFGDFNAISPEDNIPQSVVDSFCDRMKEKYCRDGKLCYDTIEAVLKEGYVDVGLQFHKPEEITDKTDLSGGTGKHTRPIRMDFIFAKESVLPYVKEFVLLREGLARTASDHFPWYIILNESLFVA